MTAWDKTCCRKPHLSYEALKVNRTDAPLHTRPSIYTGWRLLGKLIRLTLFQVGAGSAREWAAQLVGPLPPVLPSVGLSGLANGRLPLLRWRRICLSLIYDA